ncbi:dipeptidase [Planctomycetota bacterium]
MNKKKLLLGSLVIALFVFTCTSSLWACFAVVVGKDASFDGSVLVGHNEQNGGARYLNFRRIPRIKYKPGDMITFRSGGQIPQVAETYSYLWSENPGATFGDGYFNEFGVAVVSDACGDRNGRGASTEGSVSYLIRRIIVERAKTARQGVEIAGKIIEQVGYGSSRTYVIADKNEAWLMSLTRGKQWAAKRVPDDEVALLPNIYVIDDIDLNDKDNCMGSPDLIKYAVEKGWYNPDEGKPFRFCDVYASPRRTRMDPRQWRAQSLVTGREITEIPDRQLPFSVKPSHKLSIKDVVTVLRYHGGKGTICRPSTQEAAVFQLRPNMPTEIGCVYWRTTAEPCSSVLVPWYCGITETPEEYYPDVPVEKQLTLDYHFSQAPAMADLPENHAWRPFKKIQDWVGKDHDPNCKQVREFFDKFEDELLARQVRFEPKALEMFNQNRKMGLVLLTTYSKQRATEAIAQAQKLIEQLKIE